MKRFFKKIPFISYFLNIRRELVLIRHQLETQTRLSQNLLKRVYFNEKNNPVKIFPYSYEHQTFSQNGEDGIICEILKRLDIHKGNFIEIGVGDGSENNTRLLLELGWKGTWIDGDNNCYKLIKNNFSSYIKSDHLHVNNSFIDNTNINNVLKELTISQNVDVLSIDLDLTTHLVWKELKYLKAKVVILEYNGFFPDEVSWEANTENSKCWDGSINMGATLSVIRSISSEKGYTFIGCDISGTNAFFVLNEYKELFQNRNANFLYESAKPFLVNDPEHRR